jgi:hypothetical protein
MDSRGPKRTSPCSEARQPHVLAAKTAAIGDTWIRWCLHGDGNSESQRAESTGWTADGLSCTMRTRNHIRVESECTWGRVCQGQLLPNTNGPVYQSPTAAMFLLQVKSVDCALTPFHY